MKYDHSIERSTEFLRKAVPMMTQQQAGLHPVAYAVWYEYVSGINMELKGAVDQVLAQQGKLDDATTYKMFRQYVAEIDPEVAKRVSERFHKVMNGMEASAKQAGDHTAAFGNSLSRLSTEIGQHDGITPAVQSVLAETENMRRSMDELQAQLQASQSEIANLRSEVKEARRESLVDALTGLHNRRAFDAALAACVNNAKADQVNRPCLVMADIDHFKRINDTYGHAFGDQVIRTVAQVLKHVSGNLGTAARIGGEEFALLLPTANIDAAHGLAEKIRTSIGTSRIRCGPNDRDSERVTISLGVAPLRDGERGDAFMERADQALYAAKRGGRDRVAMLM